ncbi:MAG: hypothetical protein RLZZ126_1118 [Pseudomonadota bacterium]|jgi:FKBP-type peptidyl-prolyl cis-trans isomerase SlyD
MQEINSVTPQCVVALTWVLKDTLGEELDVLAEPVEFLIGGTDLLPKIEEALQGHHVGERVDIHLEPEHAFGDFDDQLLFLEPRAAFPQGTEEGMRFDGAALPQGCSAHIPPERIYFVSELYPDHVVLDGNHPLAGMALRLSARIEAVREVTEAEVLAGTAGTSFFKLESDAPLH